MRSLGILAVGLLIFAAAPAAWAHCDTLDGPVIQDARKALETRDSSWVLMWVQPRDERQIGRLFERTLVERGRARSNAARERIEMRFFEQLVRIHRAGEGAPYTGVKPVGSPVDPGIAAADAAMAAGSADQLLAKLTEHLAEGIRTRYARVLETRAHMRDSVAAGRAYVEAYVTFMHYVEGVASAIHAEAAEHHGRDAEVHSVGARHEHQSHAQQNR